MKRMIITFMAMTIVTAVNAQAANFAVITSPPVFLNAFILLLSCGCIFGCVRVYDLVRGGSMSKSWQLFLLGFVILALSQIGYLCVAFEVLSLPIFVVPAMMVLTAGLFLYGIFETKKILS